MQPGHAPATPIVAVVTPVGRDEPHYLAELGSGLSELAQLLTSASGDCAVEWILALDSPDLDPVATEDVARRSAPGVSAHVVPAHPSAPVGPASARNRALARVTAPWMMTIDSDDLVHPDGFITLLHAAEARPDLTWAAGRAWDVNPDGSFLNTGPADMLAPGVVARGSFFALRAARGCPPFHPSATIVRTDAVRRVGGWPDGWRRTEDSALWSVLDAWFAGVWVPTVVLSYRKHPQSVTHQPDYVGSAPELMPAIADFVSRGSTNP